MTNLYEQNLIEIQSQAADQELKLRERKFYSKNDLDALEHKWTMRCILYGALCCLITVLIIHYWK
jgi:hypothetical protein